MNAVTGGPGAQQPGAMVAPGLIPAWLGVIWAVLFAAVLIAHLRHIAMACPVPRRCWHLAHMLMAASMVLMYLPASLDPLHIPAGAWRALFIVMIGVLALCGANEYAEQRPVSAQWVLMGTDLAVMLYMWSPGATAVPASALIGVFLAVEGAAWASGRGVLLDRPLGPRTGVMVAGSGRLGLGGEAHAAVGATRELRVTMTVMALGMAYMILAMAVAS